MGIELSKVQTGLLIGIVLMTGFFSMVCQYFWKGGDDQLKPDYNPERARPFVPRKGYSTNPLIDYLQLQEDKIAKREGIPILPDNQGLPAVLQRGVKGEFPWPMPTFHPKDERSLSTKRYQKRMREMGRL